MFKLENIKGKIVCEGRVYDSSKIKEIVSDIQKYITSNLNENENIVAIALPRSEYLIATIWALLEKKITFLPLDISMPKDRLMQMLKIAEVKAIITLSSINDFDSEIKKICLDKLVEKDKVEFVSNEDVAYMMFTSGTTGIPKAVMITYKGFENFMIGIQQRIPLGENTIIGCFTNVMFDIFFLESIMPLLYGGTIILANDIECNNPRLILKLISDYMINTLQMTPSRYKMLEYIDTQLSFLNNVSVLMLGGESITYSCVEKIQKKSNTRIFNMYGPTETTIWSTISELTFKNKVDIGTPIQNTKIYILDDNHRKVVDGEIGEICISGSGLAKGYKNDVNKTKQVFLECYDSIGEIIYCTGDVGYVDEDGNYYCLGRKDDQIKIRGHRVEIGDIESNLIKLLPIVDVVVCWKDERLIAFYISNETITRRMFYKALSMYVPEYMIPTEQYRVDSFIYTNSGKIDRYQMVNKLENSCEKKLDSKITADISIQVCNILSTLAKMPVEEIELKTELKELGIDSLKFVSLIVELEDIYHIQFEDDKMTMVTLYNVEQIVNYVKSIKE